MNVAATNLSVLLAPLKGYALLVTADANGEIAAITIGNGTVDRRIHDFDSYRMDGPNEVANLMPNGGREWYLQIGRADVTFEASPAAAVKRLLKLTKALEAVGIISKPPADFRPYVERFDLHDGERTYTDIFPA